MHDEEGGTVHVQLSCNEVLVLFKWLSKRDDDDSLEPLIEPQTERLDCSASLSDASGFEHSVVGNVPGGRASSAGHRPDRGASLRRRWLGNDLCQPESQAYRHERRSGAQAPSYEVSAAEIDRIPRGRPPTCNRFTPVPTQ